MMAGLPAPPIKGLSLLFLKVSDVTPPSNKDHYVDINGLDIIYALERVSGRGTIEGAQRIKNIFRIYCKNKTASNKLCTEGFTFNGHQVSLYSHNPFSVSDQSSETVKITIGGVPLSVANDEFLKVLLDLKVEILSDLKFENYRDRDGKWTDYKTGRRFIYCKKPSLNLKPYVKIGLWNASIFYRGQIRPKRSEYKSTEQTGLQNSNDADNEKMDNVRPLAEVSTPTAEAVDATNLSSGSTEVINPSNIDHVATNDVDSNTANNIGKSGSTLNQEDKTKYTPDSGKSTKSSQSRGRSQQRRKKIDPKQKNISSLFRRKASPSTSRSGSKRQFCHDGATQDPPTPKSNSRSNSYHTDWFDVTVEGD